MICVVDLSNLIHTAWHAGAPSQIHAVRSMFGTIANIIERLSPEYLLFAADDGHVERTKQYPEYKAHRPPKPEGLQEQIDLAERALEAIGWPVIRAIGWEADDVVASLATQCGHAAAGVVIASRDKDLLQLVGSQGVKVYHPWNAGTFFGRAQVLEKYEVKPEQFGDYLALVSDKTDGVPGVKGIGPKKAVELLGKYGNLSTILEEARLLRIIGATGKQLREQADAARLSRQLVELRRDIPLPLDWQDWPAIEPRAGWVEALRSMGLGAVVQRLMEVIPSAGRVRSGQAAIKLEWCQIETWYVEAKLEPVTLPDDRLGDPESSLRQSVTDSGFVDVCDIFPRIAGMASDYATCVNHYGGAWNVDKVTGRPTVWAFEVNRFVIPPRAIEEMGEALKRGDENLAPILAKHAAKAKRPNIATISVAAVITESEESVPQGSLF
ncbi:5'-3' exonuclease [Schlesneria paludicola]|uniref:5'-3' exonuclease n=1 Tax=Schlesneria paludicola TaxID=360056 RepID=UPI001ED91717|nr:5'-3' exonuclease [Schlesneria paludicola]